MPTAAQYVSQLQALLPTGAAWPREEDATLTGLLAALADELARIDARTMDMISEADPRATIELLPAWERVAGLPDDCTDLAATLQERRAALVAKLISQGGQSRQFFIDLAAALGFTVTIDEFEPFTAGLPVGQALTGEDWRFAWRVNGPEVTVRYFRAGASAAGEPLVDFGNELLECVISRLKPAHTTVIFGYGA